MKFKNQLEEKAFNIANKIFKDSVNLEHNKVLRIESAIFPEIAAFSGPPKKEIDVLSADLTTDPSISILISCKDYKNYKSDPIHIQEWVAVVNIMNKYARERQYLGIILCPSGFTSGCEPWATSSNIALVPPLKGKNIKFNETTALKMFDRVLTALKKRILFPFDDLLVAPKLYEFSYELTSDFEGYEEPSKDDRYCLTNSGWSSSFGELVSTLLNKRIEALDCTDDYIQLAIEGNLIFRYSHNQIIFGENDNILHENTIIPKCTKDITFQKYSFTDLTKKIIGKEISSAGDFGTHFEFGINGEMNIGFYPDSVINLVCFNEE